MMVQLTCNHRLKLKVDSFPSAYRLIDIVQEFSVAVTEEQVGSFARVHGRPTTYSHETVEVSFPREVCCVLETDP